MNRFFNLGDVSGFLENLAEINRLKVMGQVIKENDRKGEEPQRRRFLTVPDFRYSFFEQSRQDRHLSADELDFVYCCLSIMLGFTLRSKPMVQKKLEVLANILRKREERLPRGPPEMTRVVSHMQRKLRFFQSLAHLTFGSEFPFLETDQDEPEELSPGELNLLAMRNMQRGHFSKSQLLFKRALLRAKLQNQNMSAREYVDDIYNTGTETKISHPKLSGDSSQADPFARKSHHSEEYLLYNAALLLIKRGKFLEAVETFQSLKPGFGSHAAFWYRYGQASKGVFLQDVGHVSRLYDYYFHHKKKKFFAHDRRFEKNKHYAPEDSFEDFINFYSHLIDSHKKLVKTDLRKQSNANLKDILARRKFVTMFKAKNLLSLTNRLYAQHSRWPDQEQEEAPCQAQKELPAPRRSQAPLFVAAHARRALSAHEKQRVHNPLKSAQVAGRGPVQGPGQASAS